MTSAESGGHCAQHPGAESSGVCARCGAFLCERCRIPHAEAAQMCTRCADHAIERLAKDLEDQAIVFLAMLALTNAVSAAVGAAVMFLTVFTVAEWSTRIGVGISGAAIALLLSFSYASVRVRRGALAIFILALTSASPLLLLTPGVGLLALLSVAGAAACALYARKLFAAADELSALEREMAKLP